METWNVLTVSRKIFRLPGKYCRSRWTGAGNWVPHVRNFGHGFSYRLCLLTAHSVYLQRTLFRFETHVPEAGRGAPGFVAAAYFFSTPTIRTSGICMFQLSWIDSNMSRKSRSSPGLSGDEATDWVSM